MNYLLKISIMRKQLKEYRKSNGFSKKEIANELGIKLEEYKLLEKGKMFNDDLKVKIKSLLSKEEKKTAQIELPRGIVNMSKSINKIVGITSPIQEMMNKVNVPLNQAITLQSIGGSLNPSLTALDYLKDMRSKQDIRLNVFGGIADLTSSMKVAAENNLKAYNGFQIVFGNQSNSLKSAIDMQESLLANINEPMNSLKAITNSIAFQNITDQIKTNRRGYDNYINFSSALTKTLFNSAISGATFNNFFSADSFITREKEPSVLDILSGSNFTLFDDTESFDEEREIIQQIDDDPELKEQAESFFNELNQIINDNTVELIDEEKIKSLFSKFVGWISENFNKDIGIAKKIAKRFIVVFPFIAFFIAISYAEINSYQNKIEHEATQEELQDFKSIIKEHIENDEDNTQKLFDLYQGIFDRIDSKFSQKMVALKDVNLRIRRSTQSKVIDKILASQKVIVLDRKVKWMKIVYIDIKDQKPKTGWVYIENFK